MKKIIYTLLTIMIFTCMTTNANAVVVTGIDSCGEWVTEKNKNNNQRNKDWLLGYISGLARASSTDVLRGTSNQSMFLWMDNYCNTNPLKHVSEAAETLFFELKKQKSLK